MKRATMVGVVCGLMMFMAAPARAQLNGSHTLGDYGVMSGSQPAPGLYAALFYYRYDTDTLKDREGATIRPFAGDPTSITLNAYSPMVLYVSATKVFGANLGAFATFPFVGGSIEAPAAGFGQASDTRFTDMLVRPFDLGWHVPRADVNAGFQFYAPTGTYQFQGQANTGKGMWTYEPFVGTTIYLDGKRSLSLATTAYWEIHGKKKDTDIKVGQILTLQGGLGKSLLGGGLVFGAAYYAQWKLTADELGSFGLPGGNTHTLDLSNMKHDVFAVGPEVTLPVASKTRLFALINMRYLWETTAHSKTMGSGLIVTTTFPVPSVRLGPPPK